MTASAQETSDLELLRAYAQSRDAQAFAELVRRYAAMVYGTALRVTGSKADAADVSQECFLALATESRRHCQRIATSVPGWLHALARSRAIDLLRSASARRRREQQAAAVVQEVALGDWEKVEPHVDAAIAELPDDLRDLVVQHFLAGRAQRDMAASTGLSQATISRRLAQAVEQLRTSLERSGAELSVAVLTEQLAQHGPTPAVPPALTASLGKMAITGVGAAAPGIATKLAIVAILVLAIVAAWQLVGTGQTRPAAAQKGTTMNTTTTQSQSQSPEPGPAAPQRPATVVLPTPDPKRHEGMWFPQNEPVPAVLMGVADVMHEDLGLSWPVPRDGMNRTYLTFMGITGDAFWFPWLTVVPRSPAAPMDLSMDLYMPDPAPMYQRTLAAAGITCEVYAAPRLPQADAKPRPLDVPDLKDRVLACLADRRMPVIIRGVPQRGDFLVATGYEDQGNTLVGAPGRGGGSDMSFAPGSLRKVPDWLSRVNLVVIPTGRQPRPSEKQMFREALVQAVQLMRQEQIGLMCAGPGFFDLWADAMVDDQTLEQFGPGVEPATPPTPENRRRLLVCPMAWEVMERTSYAAIFLTRAEAIFPETATELGQARAAIGEVDKAAHKVDQLMGPGQTPREGWPGIKDPQKPPTGCRTDPRRQDEVDRGGGSPPCGAGEDAVILVSRTRGKGSGGRVAFPNAAVTDNSADPNVIQTDILGNLLYGCHRTPQLIPRAYAKTDAVVSTRRDDSPRSGNYRHMLHIGPNPSFSGCVPALARRLRNEGS